MATAFDEIRLAEDEKIKVWDVLLTPEGIKLPFQLTPPLKKFTSEDIDALCIPREEWEFIGRIRILAVLNKKPAELKNIRFAISYCAPSDLFKYRRDRANAICVGRWNKAFASSQLNVGGCENLYLINHTGVIPELTSLKRDEVVCEALACVNGLLPQWLQGCQFFNKKLDKRLLQEYVDE